MCGNMPVYWISLSQQQTSPVVGLGMYVVRVALKNADIRGQDLEVQAGSANIADPCSAHSGRGG